MAISKTHYEILRDLRWRNLLPRGKSIMEIGQANFYGDMDPSVLAADIPLFVESPDKEVCQGLYRKAIESQDLFLLASVMYRTLFSTDKIDAIDPGGSGPRCRSKDLNEHVPVDRYGTVFNHGTAEHVFNIANVFRVIHEATADNGLMIHESPFTGWVNHGFYCLQPTLFYDVAAANGYEVVGVWIEHLASQTYQAIECHEHILEIARRDQLPNNAMLFVVLRKFGDQEFKYPQQAVYSGGSEAIKAAWCNLR